MKNTNSRAQSNTDWTVQDVVFGNAIESTCGRKTRAVPLLSATTPVLKVIGSNRQTTSRLEHLGSVTIKFFIDIIGFILRFFS